MDTTRLQEREGLSLEIFIYVRGQNSTVPASLQRQLQEGALPLLLRQMKRSCNCRTEATSHCINRGAAHLSSVFWLPRGLAAQMTVDA